MAVILHGKKTEAAKQAALMSAFADPKFHPGNTGYVGPDLNAIRAVLAGATGSAPPGDTSGNIREVWALMYALTKNSWENPFGETLTTISEADMKVRDQSERADTALYMCFTICAEIVDGFRYTDARTKFCCSARAARGHQRDGECPKIIRQV